MPNKNTPQHQFPNNKKRNIGYIGVFYNLLIFEMFRSTVSPNRILALVVSDPNGSHFKQFCFGPFSAEHEIDNCSASRGRKMHSCSAEECETTFFNTQFNLRPSGVRHSYRLRVFPGASAPPLAASIRSGGKEEGAGRGRAAIRHFGSPGEGAGGRRDVGVGERAAMLAITPQKCAGQAASHLLPELPAKPEARRPLLRSPGGSPATSAPRRRQGAGVPTERPKDFFSIWDAGGRPHTPDSIWRRQMCNDRPDTGVGQVPEARAQTAKPSPGVVPSVRALLLEDRPSSRSEAANARPPTHGAADARSVSLADFDGTWISRGDGELRGRIENGRMIWAEDDSETLLTAYGHGDIVSTLVDGVVYSAVLSEDKNVLRWGDGDHWIRADEQANRLLRYCSDAGAVEGDGQESPAIGQAVKWERWHKQVWVPHTVLPPMPYDDGTSYYSYSYDTSARSSGRTDQSHPLDSEDESVLSGSDLGG